GPGAARSARAPAAGRGRCAAPAPSAALLRAWPRGGRAARRRARGGDGRSPRTPGRGGRAKRDVALPRPVRRRGARQRVENLTAPVAGTLTHARSYVGASPSRNLVTSKPSGIPEGLAPLHERAALRAASTAWHSCSQAYPLLSASCAFGSRW